jgi:hypothetical protein
MEATPARLACTWFDPDCVLAAVAAAPGDDGDDGNDASSAVAVAGDGPC